ncbi:hypothetical protein H6P81_019497 [Aristolochia fimbriata]|uniref:Uncharacterized protein n=1 Tax=Aristolochia fimbriata TaxID=158543 RepID=A0AAV7DVM8_ARIFI|nr:hypothetical protein H6P81_019497 [Aristolochia fimbriata]
MRHPLNDCWWRKISSLVLHYPYQLCCRNFYICSFNDHKKCLRGGRCGISFEAIRVRQRWWLFVALNFQRSSSNFLCAQVSKLAGRRSTRGLWEMDISVWGVSEIIS